MDIKKSAPIGIFDSGVGGLTVAREIMRQLPNEQIVYFGDTARVPYGSKSKNNIIKYSRQIVRFLLSRDVKAIVVACNTASALALDEIKDEINIPIIGVVRPGAVTAVKSTRNKRVGVIGTDATIKSELYTEYIHELDKDITVIGKACPLFCPLVEEGMLHDEVTDEIARRYLSGLQTEDIDTLILGCTHYPLLRSTVSRIMGEKVNLINPAYETAMSLKQLLIENNLLNDDKEENDVKLYVKKSEVILPENDSDDGDYNGKYEFYVSDAAGKFRTFANSILPFEIESINQINIEEY